MVPEQNTIEQQKTDNPTPEAGKAAAGGRWEGSKIQDTPPTKESVKAATSGKVGVADNKKGGASYSKEMASEEGAPFSTQQVFWWSVAIVALVALAPTIVHL